MSTVKQFVFSQSEDFYATSQNSIGYAINDREPAGGDGGTALNFINKNNPNESYAHAQINAQVSSVKRSKFQYTGTPLTQSPQGIPSNRCRAIITGRYRVKVGGWAGPTNGQFPWSMPLYFWTYDGDGNYVFTGDSATITTFVNSNVSGTYGDLPSTLYYGNTFGGGQDTLPQVSFESRGSDTEAGELNQHQNMMIEMDASRPTTSYPNSNLNGPNYPLFQTAQDGFTGMQIVFQGIPHPGNANFKPFFVGTISRSWESNQYIFDGQDNDTINFQPVVFSFSDQSTATLRLDATAIVNCQFGVNDSSVNLKFATVEPVLTSSSLLVEPSFLLGTQKTLSTTADLLSSTFNLKLGDADLGTEFDINIDPTYKPGDILTIPSAFTQASTAGLIYDINPDYSWNTFNLNIYFETGFVEDGFVSDQGEYNWNFLENVTWDNWTTVTWQGNEATWDNWPDDVWETIYTLNWIGTTQTEAKLFLNIDPAIEFTSAFALAEQSAFEKASSFDADAEFTASFTASGRIDVFGTINANFSPELTANIRYVLNDAPIEITGAFSPVLTASAITDTLSDIDVAFALQISPTFKPAAFDTQLSVNSTTDFLGNEIYGPSLALLAFAAKFVEPRLFFAADPFNIATIPQETRAILVPEQNRQAVVSQEIRLNTIAAETRGYLVPQETRNLKLRVAPFKNRFSIPKVRAEQ